ncbi:OmpA family protein [Candidatus Sororendozoicomonas aggregata]|uniref:OmpA family protein n=1 Tax=Candidatus Sororendozoicomonas aggregata TaxID=3073239 RepID=UPI002ECFFA49
MGFNQKAKVATLLLICVTLFGCSTGGGLKRWQKCAIGGAAIGGGVGGIIGSNNRTAGALTGAVGGALLSGLICAFTGDETVPPAPRATTNTDNTNNTAKKDTLVVVEPVVVPVPVAEKLGTVHFKTGCDALDAKAKHILQDLAGKAKANNILDLTVAGFTDNTGESKGYDNLALSKRRAESVIKYLESLGVSVKRVDDEAGGVIQQGNDTEKGRAENRKADIFGTLAKEKPEGH